MYTKVIYRCYISTKSLPTFMHSLHSDSSFCSPLLKNAFPVSSWHHQWALHWFQSIGYPTRPASRWRDGHHLVPSPSCRVSTRKYHAWTDRVKALCEKCVWPHIVVQKNSTLCKHPVSLFCVDLQSLYRILHYNSHVMINGSVISVSKIIRGPKTYRHHFLIWWCFIFLGQVGEILCIHALNFSLVSILTDFTQVLFPVNFVKIFVPSSCSTQGHSKLHATAFEFCKCQSVVLIISLHRTCRNPDCL